MRQALLGLLLGFSLTLLLATSWNAGYEAVPAGTDLASDLDLFIQGFKAEVRQRMEAEHIFGGSTDDNGLHQMGSARCFLQNGAPTDISNGTAALGQYNSAASADGGTALTTDEVGATTRDIGAGRCWFDLDGADGTAGTQDDYQLYTWNETTNAWVAATASPASVLAGQNLIFNGDFEITDGTGSTASISVPLGWALSATPDIAYDDPTAVSEGEGVALETIATVAGNEGVSQSLSGLKANTDYVIRARVRPVTAGDTCDLRVTGGDAPGQDVSATGGNVFETLELTVNTTGTPDPLVVILEANAATDECDWDHVTAFERNATVSQPGVQAIYTTDTTNAAVNDAAFPNTSILTTPITIPGPGYIVVIDATVQTRGTTGAVMLMRLTRDDCAGGAFTAKTPVMGGFEDNSGSVNNVINYVDTAPIVGGTCIYRVEVRRDDGASGEVNDIAGTEATQTGSSLRLLLIPTR